MASQPRVLGTCPMCGMTITVSCIKEMTVAWKPSLRLAWVTNGAGGRLVNHSRELDMNASDDVRFAVLYGAKMLKQAKSAVRSLTKFLRALDEELDELGSDEELDEALDERVPVPRAQERLQAVERVPVRVQAREQAVERVPVRVQAREMVT